MIKRRLTKQISVGNVCIGSEFPVAVQSMTDTDTKDIKKTVNQIKRLKNAGCEIVRVAIPDKEAAEALKYIVKKVDLPVVADIHFDADLAVMAADNGAAKLRINPGNIGGKDKVKKVIDAAKNRGIPIRIGVNAGSIEKDIIKKYGEPSGTALAESVMRYVELVEGMKFSEIILSAKAFDVNVTVEANRIIAKETNYPLHLGITEAGTLLNGAIRSAAGMGILLSEGIGDTIRVSLADNPVKEIDAAYCILNALNIRSRGAVVIACPTCGRTQIDVKGIARKVEKLLKGVRIPCSVAVMGCIVNGPGEAKMADIGMAGGAGKGVIFEKGKVIETLPEDMLVDEIVRKVKELEGETIKRTKN